MACSAWSVAVPRLTGFLVAFQGPIDFLGPVGKAFAKVWRDWAMKNAVSAITPGIDAGFLLA